MKRVWLINLITPLFIIVYTIAAITVSLQRYWQYQMYYFDLGIFSSIIWQASRFKLPVIDHFSLSETGIISFADHFNPSIFLLSPLFWVTEKTEVLLIVQAICVGLAAFVGYLIARKFIKSKVAQFSLVVAFLGYVGLQNALITEFHEATISILPLMIIFWSIFNNKWKFYLLSLIILLGLKETFSGLGVGIGLYLILRKKYILGIVTILISIIWGVVVINLIIPYFSGGNYLYSPAALPTDLSSFADRILNPASKLETIFYSFLTFGFLPIFDIAILPAIFENFFERFILSNRGLDLGFHYNAPLSPLLFIGTLFAFQKMQENIKLRRFVTIYAIFIILIVLFLHRVILRGPLGLFYNPVFYQQTQRLEYLNNFVDKFPKDGKIMTQNNLAVRMSHYEVFLLRKDYKQINPNYIIFDLTPGQNPNSFFPLNFDDANLLKEKLLKDGNYKLDKYTENQYIFSKIK